MRALTVLCKVVDNFGDIGFVYRLSKNLCKVNPDCDIRIITNDVGTFLKLAPELGGKTEPDSKTKNGGAGENCKLTEKRPARIRLLDSNDADLCRAEFAGVPGIHVYRDPHLLLGSASAGRDSAVVRRGASDEPVHRRAMAVPYCCDHRDCQRRA